MTSGSCVLVGFDLSDPSFAALEQAAHWARRHHVPLSVAHVTPESTFQYTSEGELRSAIGRLVQERISIEAQVVVRRGTAHAALIELAEEQKASLLVVGASGAGALARALFGSTASSITRYASCSVLVARPSPDSGPIVVGTDFSDAVTPALVAAYAEAKLRKETLLLVHSLYEPSSPLDLLGPIVVSPPQPSKDALEARRQAAMTTLESLLAAHGAVGQCVVVGDAPATALVEQADASGASLLVVGSHGRTGFTRMALGSVAEQVAARAPCSVLISRAHS